MIWPEFVYRMAAYFDESPFIKASLVFCFFLDVIVAVVSVIAFAVKIGSWIIK